MNRLLIFLSGMLMVFSCGTQNGYRLSGTIAGLHNGTIYLQQRMDKEYISVDSVNSSDGTFEFTGTVDIPDVYYIYVPAGKGRSMLFLENSEISLTAHADSLFYPEITGSAVHDEYMAFNRKVDDIYQKAEDLYPAYRAANQSGETEKASELERRMEAIYEEAEACQTDFLKENSSSFIAPYVVQSLHYGKEADEIEQLLSQLDPSLQSSSLVGSMSRRVEVLKTVAVGKTAPDFSQDDKDGNPVRLSSLRGKYLLVDFWASWCGPCRRENPNVVKAYEKFHEKGFDILGVSLDESRERWLQAIEDDKLIWIHVSDLRYWSNEAAALYGISSIPSNLLLDPEGKIIAKNLRGEDLHTELAKLLAP